MGMRWVWGALVVMVTAGSATGAGNPFYMGADVSLLPFIEQQGGVFRDHGKVEPMEQILADHGANLFRLRIFVNPNTNYAATGGAIQDLNYDLALAQRLKATGAKLLLDFHYSDTWADPGKQNTPAAWSSLNITQMSTAIHNYTLDTLNAFKAAGVLPDMVQVGNEITAGMDWPTGQINFNGTTQQQNQSWANFGQLLNSAISGVRAATPAGAHIDVAVHIDRGNQSGLPRFFFDNLASKAVVSDFDIIGLSYYPTATSDLGNLKANLNDIVTRYSQRIMILEDNYPWTGTAPAGAPYPYTPAGQLQELTDTRDALLALPNGRGEGVVWWYPESIPVSGASIFKNGQIALFDQNGNALPAVNVFALPEPAAVWVFGAGALGLLRRRSPTRKNRGVAA